MTLSPQYWFNRYVMHFLWLRFYQKLGMRIADEQRWFLAFNAAIRLGQTIADQISEQQQTPARVVITITRDTGMNCLIKRKTDFQTLLQLSVKPWSPFATIRYEGVEAFEQSYGSLITALGARGYSVKRGLK